MAVAEKAVSALEEPAFVMHHLPGCGPKELMAFVYGCFAVVHDEPDAFQTDPSSGEEVLPVDTSTLSSVELFLFRAHFRPGEVEIGRMYPEFFSDPRFFTILILDDPLRILAVHYRHEQKTRGEDYTVTFGQFTKGRCGVFTPGLHATKENWRSILARYSFVGIASPTRATVDRLVSKVEERVAAAGQRANPRRLQVFIDRWRERREAIADEGDLDEVVESLTWWERTTFWWRNRLDYRMWEEAKRNGAVR